MFGLLVKGFTRLAGITATGAGVGVVANQVSKLMGGALGGGDKGPKQQSSKPLTTGETDGQGGIREEM